MARSTPNRNDEKYVRQDMAQNLLQQFLAFKLPHSESITQLDEGYFLLEDIVKEPAFAAHNFTVKELVDAIHADGLLRFSVRDTRVRFKPPELNKSRSVIVSKKLAWILRHGAERKGLKFKDGGFLYLDEVLRLNEFQGVTEAEVMEAVETNSKKRYETRVEPESSKLQIRAVQGHSIQVDDLGLKPLLNVAEFPEVLHGTYYRAWQSIKQTGLSKMQRTHIHFAPGENGANDVISGMRGSAEIAIYIDLEAALKDGIKFFISTNNVILSPGDEHGCISPRYFKRVIDRKTSEFSTVTISNPKNFSEKPIAC